MRRTHLLVTAIVGFAGCTKAPEPASRLDRPRVLGAEVYAESEPARSSVRAGERVHVDVRTASRVLSRGAFATHGLRVCAVGPDPRADACVGPDLAFVESGDPDAKIVFDAPAGAPDVVVFGIFCAGPAARLVPGALAGSCDGAPGQEVAIRVDVGGPPNLRPAFDEASARVDGVALSPDDACASPGAITLPADGAKHTLFVAAAPSAIEPGDDIVVSHVATHGELDRLYSLPDASRVFSVEWSAPSSLGQARETARFVLVLRDGRGGTTFLTRTVCLSKGA